MTTTLLRYAAWLRHLAAAKIATTSLSSLPRGLHSSSLSRLPLTTTPFLSVDRFTSRGTRHSVTLLGLPPSPFSHFQIGVRWKTKETRARAPDTPVKSKIKKYKIKGYSSYKRRFKPLNDGTIRRWKEGNAHNAHCKSKKQKRRLRKPALVSLAYAKVMKKLHFFG